MTSEVKRQARAPSLFDLPSHGLPPRAARSCAQREGSRALDPQSGEIRCSTLRRSPISMSPRGTNRTRPSARPPLPRSGRRTRSRQNGSARIRRAHEAHPRSPRKERQAATAFAFAPPPARASARDVVTFRWEMLLADSETVLASGLEFLIVDDDGRILVDHPFAPA